MSGYTRDKAWLVVHPKGDEEIVAIRSTGAMKKRDQVVIHEVFPYFDTAVDAARSAALSEGLSLAIDPRLGELRLLRSDTKGDGVFWVVVLKNGGSDLAVAEAQWFDVDDYSYAHPCSFDDEKDADAAAREISERYGTPYESEYEADGPSF